MDSATQAIDAIAHIVFILCLTMATIGVTIAAMILALPAINLGRVAMREWVAAAIESLRKQRPERRRRRRLRLQLTIASLQKRIASAEAATSALQAAKALSREEAARADLIATATEADLIDARRTVIEADAQAQAEAARRRHQPRSWAWLTWSALVVVVIAAIGGIGWGLNQWERINLQTHHANVVVYRSYVVGIGDPHDEAGGAIIITSGGKFYLDPGLYNCRYFTDPQAALKLMLVNHRYRVAYHTAHEGPFGTFNYLTAAQDTVPEVPPCG